MSRAESIKQQVSDAGPLYLSTQIRILELVEKSFIKPSQIAQKFSAHEKAASGLESDLPFRPSIPTIVCVRKV